MKKFSIEYFEREIRKLNVDRFDKEFNSLEGLNKLHDLFIKYLKRDYSYFLDGTDICSNGDNPKSRILNILTQLKKQERILGKV